MAFFEGIQGFEGEEVDNTPPRPPHRLSPPSHKEKVKTKHYMCFSRKRSLDYYFLLFLEDPISVSVLFFSAS